MNTVIIGVFYETPEGKIARTYSWSGKNKTVGYYFDEENGYGTVKYEVFKTWKLRKDLKDFPNARDPRVPYIFDLYWDIKYLSELKAAMQNHKDSAEIIKTVKEYYPKAIG